MTDLGSQSKDFYAVLGLPKTCSTSEIRSAYRRLAMIWHPDKCSGDTDPEQAKLKFQAIQEAYAVLSDSTKRFLYDAGVYEEDDDDDKDYGMCDFLGEITRMMKEVKEQNDSNEDLRDVFMKMINPDIPPSSNQCNGRSSPAYQCSGQSPYQKERDPTSSRASCSKQQQENARNLQGRTATQRCRTTGQSKRTHRTTMKPCSGSSSSSSRRRRSYDTNSCNIFDDNTGLGLGIENSHLGLGFGIENSHLGLGFGIENSHLGLGLGIENSHLGLGMGIHFPVSKHSDGLNFKLDSDLTTF